jgi:hypothetical protein
MIICDVTIQIKFNIVEFILVWLTYDIIYIKMLGRAFSLGLRLIYKRNINLYLLGALNHFSTIQKLKGM